MLNRISVAAFLNMFFLLAIAVLWIEFVREVRWCWEESQPLPRMLGSGVIDLSTCLVNQKLQMVIGLKKNILSGITFLILVLYVFWQCS